MTRIPTLALATILIALIALSMVASVAIGSRAISPDAVAQALIHYTPTNDEHLIIHDLRLPRTIIAVLVGAQLGVAGVLVQALTRNPLAEPGTLAINAGAACAVVVGLAFFPSLSMTAYVWLAFIGAGLTSAVIYRLGTDHRGGHHPVRLILAGAGLSISLSSLTTIMVLSHADTVFDTFRTWITGSLQGRRMDSVPLLVATSLIGITLALLMARSLNSITLGRDMALSLGTNLCRTWILSNLAMLILAGGATAVVGPISFIGLAGPHIARHLVGSNHRVLIPISALISALVLLIADISGRIIASPTEIGAGMMTSLIGAPIFIALVRRGVMKSL